MLASSEEQYSHRESIQINGIPNDIDDNEDALADFIINIGDQMEAPVKRDDISVVHRAGKSTHNSRPVLVKFVSRNTRDKLMKNRQKLKDISVKGRKIYFNDDLTPLRAKLFSYAKNLENVKCISTTMINTLQHY